MACTPGEANTADTGDRSGATTLSDVHPDIIQSHILTRLDGAALASAATTCSQLHTLCSTNSLWAHACHATWPSTLSPRVRHVISTFPNGSGSFFADSFPSSRPSPTAPTNHNRTRKLISAVDLFHGQDLLFSKVTETETGTGWFRCSPFRIDLVEAKDVVRTGVKYPVDEDTCRDLEETLRLSWIVIDAAERRAVDVSSRRAVSVRKHWLSGEVEARFATAVEGGERGTAREAVLCSVVVTWGGEMEVREVSLQMEDMDGMQMNGRDSLVILKRALEGKRVKRVEDGGSGFREFLRKKKERMERKVRGEGRLDMLCLGLAVFSTFSALLFFSRY